MWRPPVFSEERLRALEARLVGEGWGEREAKLLAWSLMVPLVPEDEAIARIAWMRGPKGNEPTPLDGAFPPRPVAGLDVLRCEALCELERLMDAWLPETLEGGPLPLPCVRTRPGWARRYRLDLYADRGLCRFDWREETTRGAGNDVISLAAHLAGVRWSLAASRLARMLGLEGARHAA
jgi:hypothetical protein